MIKVEVDRDKGTLRYYKNEKDLGIAFTDERLKTIPLHFAISANRNNFNIEIVN